jgi:hypothetical protein
MMMHPMSAPVFEQCRRRTGRCVGVWSQIQYLQAHFRRPFDILRNMISTHGPHEYFFQDQAQDVALIPTLRIMDGDFDGHEAARPPNAGVGVWNFDMFPPVPVFRKDALILGPVIEGCGVRRGRVREQPSEIFDEQYPWEYVRNVTFRARVVDPPSDVVKECLRMIYGDDAVFHLLTQLYTLTATHVLPSGEQNWLFNMEPTCYLIQRPGRWAEIMHVTERPPESESEPSDEDSDARPYAAPTLYSHWYMQHMKILPVCSAVAFAVHVPP